MRAVRKNILLHDEPIEAAPDCLDALSVAVRDERRSGDDCR